MKSKPSIKYLLVTIFTAQVCFFQVQTSNAADEINYAAVQKFVADHNIFNPYRRAGVIDIRPPRTNIIVRPPVVNSFALVGTMNYGDGDKAGLYAFFDGNNMQFRKAAVVDDSIAIFKIVAIDRDSATLMHETNEIVLRLGYQMREDSPGNWKEYGQVMASYSPGFPGGPGGFDRNMFNGGGGGRSFGRNSNNDYNSPNNFRNGGFGNNNSGNNNFRGGSFNTRDFGNGNSPNSFQFDRTQRGNSRGRGTSTTPQDFPQDSQDTGFGGFPDGTQVIVIPPDFSNQQDAAPVEE